VDEGAIDEEGALGTLELGAFDADELTAMPELRGVWGSSSFDGTADPTNGGTESKVRGAALTRSCARDAGSPSSVTARNRSSTGGASCDRFRLRAFTLLCSMVVPLRPRDLSGSGAPAPRAR
jgi:hypothetical protein